MKSLRFSRVIPSIVCATCVYVVLATLSASHPLLGALLVTLGVGCSLLALFIWGWLHFSSCKRRLGTVRRTMMRYSQALTHRTQQKKRASIDQIQQLQKNVARLQMTFFRASEGKLDHVNIDHCQRFPDLVLPQDAKLYAEFEGLNKVLLHLGVLSSSLEGVRLQQKDLIFLQQWGGDLETRLLRHQRQTFEQWQTVRGTLKALVQQHQEFGQMHSSMPVPMAEAYYRMQEEMRFLTTMINDPRCSLPLAQHSVREVQHDMNRLIMRQRLATA